MLVSAASPLQSIEPRLRAVLPADLYAAAWLDPSVKTLQAVFEHLRSLRRILHSYVPQHVARSLARPGDVRFDWQTGSLMFTDLAGFTSLMEAAARSGPSGAQILLAILKAYFARMIEIIETSGGTLLEFTGDALLAAFLPDGRRNDTAQAVRAGLRMQRAMAAFSRLDTSFGAFSLDMRVGIHAGRFLRADIGTPRRMDHVLLGHDVQVAKLTESRGQRGRVNLSAVARNRVDERFRFEHGEGDDHFVVDDLDEAELGAFDLALTTRRLGAQILFDRSIDGLVSEITAGLELIEPLAAYVPTPVLNLLVENTARREVPPDFQSPTIVFVNLIGLSEAIDRSDVGETTALIVTLSRIFTLINAAVEARGGVLKKVTYQLNGSDILIFFGTPHAHSDDPIRAADAALAIRAIVDATRLPAEGAPPLRARIGLARGPVFAGEIGEPRGRREFNILGDAVNVAARLMSRARLGEILMTPAVRDELGTRFATDMGEKVRLKGLADELHVFSLRGHAGELRDTASAREAVPTVPTAPIRHDMPPSRLASAV